MKYKFVQCLKLDTVSTGFPSTKIWFSSNALYLRKFISICIHFLWFNFIPRWEAKADISFSTSGIELGEYLGTISRAEVSSTNLILPGQSLSRELMRTANNNGPNFVPWGRPPFVFFQDDEEFPTLTHRSRFERKALIQRIMAGSTPRLTSSLTITLWSTKSKPFLKSAKNNLAVQEPFSRAFKIECIRYTKAWVVDFFGSANCLLSNLSTIWGNSLSKVQSSITFAIWEVNDVGLKSSSIFVGGETLCTGATIDLFKAIGKTPCFMDEL